MTQSGSQFPGTILITGANGGLGIELARSFLEGGQKKIAFNVRNSSSEIEALLKEFNLPQEKHLFRADLCNETDVRRLRGEIEKIHKFEKYNLSHSSIEQKKKNIFLFSQREEAEREHHYIIVPFFLPNFLLHQTKQST